MTTATNFKELVIDAMGKRAAIQLENMRAREDIVAALLAAHDLQTPWRAEPPDDDNTSNVTKRLNAWCQNDFRVHLVIRDGGKVQFPKLEPSEPFTAGSSAEALQEIARRFALHRMPDEAVVVRRSIQTR